MESIKIELNGGTRAACLEAGDGEQSLLLLHGNSLNKETFLPLLDSTLADRYRLLAVDFPGHGETETGISPDRIYTVEGLVGFVQDVVRALDLSSPVLLGHSLGGHIAIEAAEGIPGLRGLFTTGTPPLTFAETGHSPFLEHPAIPLIFTDELNEDQRKQLSAAYWDDHNDEISLIDNAIRATDPLFRATIGADVASGNFRDEAEVLSGLSFPPAVAIGERDPLVNREYIDHVVDREQVWKEEVLVIEGAGHTPQLERPDSFNRLVDTYIQDIFKASGQ